MNVHLRRWLVIRGIVVGHANGIPATSLRVIES